MTNHSGDLQPTINRRTMLTATAAVGGAMMLPAGAFAQAAEAKKGGVLKVAMPYNPAALDAMTGRNVPDFNSLYALYDSLISFDPDTLELQPMLATKWEFTDPTTLVLDLREGVKFHDGSDFNAEAVVFYFNRCETDPRSNVKSDLVSVASYEATGPHQVTMKLKAPDASLLTILTGRIGCIASMEAIKKAADGNIDRTPVGTGPFKFVEWKDNDLIKVEKNPDYWQAGLPYLDGIDFRIVNELNTAARTVTAGETQLALNMGAQQVLTARRAGGDISGEAGPSLIFYTVMMNFAKAPLDNVKVRQALNYAVNREDLNKVLMLGLGEPTCTMFPANFWAVDPENVAFYKQDIAKAKALLAEAGHPNGITIDTWGWPDQAAVQRMELLQSQLAEAGIKLNVTPAPPAQVNQSFYIEGKGSMILNPQGGWADPSQTYERLLSASGQFNAGKTETKEFRELLDATKATSDQAERKAAFAKLERYTVENALQLPMFTSAAMYVQSNKLKDFKFGVVHSPRFHTVWLDA